MGGKNQLEKGRDELCFPPALWEIIAGYPNKMPN